MAVMRYFDGNYHLSQFGRFDDYTITQLDANTLTVQYDAAALGTYDATGNYPWKAVFTLSGGVLETLTDGPFSGQDRITAGTVTGVQFFDDSANLLASMSDLNRSASIISSYFFAGDGFSLSDYLFGGALKIIGSADSGDPDWDGDHITTGSGRNVVKAGAGDDFIDDAGGRDVYKGGAGFDMVSYGNANHLLPGEGRGIVANLAKNFIRGFDGAKDKVVSIEGVQGTLQNDKFVGDGHDNQFSGFAGRDVINGRGGFDTVDMRDKDYLGGVSGVTVNLATGTATDSWGTHDKLKNIEAARGTQFDDVFTDDKKDNQFRGRDGDDTFHMHRGDDAVQTGDGADTIIFHGTDTGHNEIWDFTAGTDVINATNTASYGDFTFTDDTNGVLVEWAGGDVFLVNVFTADLSAADFGY